MGSIASLVETSRCTGPPSGVSLEMTLCQREKYQRVYGSTDIKFEGNDDDAGRLGRLSKAKGVLLVLAVGLVTLVIVGAALSHSNDDNSATTDGPLGRVKKVLIDDPLRKVLKRVKDPLDSEDIVRGLEEQEKEPGHSKVVEKHEKEKLKKLKKLINKKKKVNKEKDSWDTHKGEPDDEDFWWKTQEYDNALKYLPKDHPNKVEHPKVTKEEESDSWMKAEEYKKAAVAADAKECSIIGK